MSPDGSPVLSGFETLKQRISLRPGQVAGIDCRFQPRPGVPDADLANHLIKLSRLARATQTSRLGLRDSPGLHQPVQATNDALPRAWL